MCPSPLDRADVVTGFDRQTLDFYAAEAGPYLSHRPDGVDPKVADFLKLLRPGARILELGCGGGAETAYMVANGFDVEPTDGVAAMAAKAEERLGRPVGVMRFDELDVISRYDAIVANACLLHVPTSELAAILARIWRALLPGGLHFATYKTGAPESRDEHGRYYNYLSREDAELQYRAAGDWASLEYEEFAGVGYFSKPAHWLSVVACKKS